MLFNSFDFLIFVPIVFFIYWFITHRNLKLQNSLLLIASYFFYSYWDYRFLGLLIFSTGLDYFTGIKIFESKDRKLRKIWFWSSIFINVGFLAIFKYYNFFAESFAELLQKSGIKIDVWTLSVILPVGISFYTFHGLSYVIDIYKQRIKPERNFIVYAVFVSFFPLLVAGPIERSTHLLPQINKKRIFNYAFATDGIRQILWGLFKKVVIADGCAEFSNLIFNDISYYSGGILLIGAISFSIQIYCDFSGYSDIAIGTAKLFGIKLMKNFSFPYFSRDIAEFWRSWHISLSTWFRDYLYIPLGGSKGGNFIKVRNTFIIFIVSGFWHGANWTFIFWGFLNALFFIPLLLTNKNRDNIGIVAEGKLIPSIKELIQILTTFSLTIFAWIFFRANNLTDAFKFVYKIFQGLFQRNSYVEALNFIFWEVGITLPILIIFLILIEWLGRSGDFALNSIFIKSNQFIRWSFYFLVLILTFQFSYKEQFFIYFQF
jgi:alginate O-acetyltransferase complex protein AlgI